ncbi:GNAT family N-acetyltransferase [Halobacillus halophilus]|uniref:GNAT family N-acetyltransferase n=1 Tax=Halobacillus halophilus TaxID=1570 RepID=UPI001CD446E7|nr:GNAT family N-acetyltransferase [Halobacillus halophilus]MCA1011600.1 GNAT family N-acetyltransferase [Halobacillus halophilus]
MFTFIPLNMEFVKEIDSWNYEGFIEQVVMTPYFESYKKTQTLKGPGGCDGFVGLLNHEAAGLFEFNLDGNIMEIGLALKPNLIGKGLGANYVQEGIDFGIQYYDTKVDIIKLVVDSRNKSAIRVYEKVGFSTTEHHADEIEMSMKREEFL